MSDNLERKQPVMEEKILKAMSGMAVMILNIVLTLASIALMIWGFMQMWLPLAIPATLYACIVGPLLFAGLKILRPREALVLTLFGKYHGTLVGPGFFFVNPFVSALHPATTATTSGSIVAGEESHDSMSKLLSSGKKSKGSTVSLKNMTLNNDRQKINDLLGNPIIIGIVVIWRVVNTAKAVFNVDNYTEFLSIQCDSALRNIVRLYPYDRGNDDSENEKTLRGSSLEIAEKLREEIQSKVDIAGLEISEARITHLAYAPEIAAAMLQRQQASAVIDARQMIVEGAVGMVEMALARLSEKEIVNLDEERKAAMVSNLLVVLCGNKDAQPIVNSGSLY